MKIVQITITYFTKKGKKEKEKNLFEGKGMSGNGDNYCRERSQKSKREVKIFGEEIGETKGADKNIAEGLSQ